MGIKVKCAPPVSFCTLCKKLVVDIGAWFIFWSFCNISVILFAVSMVFLGNCYLALLSVKLT